MGAVALGKASIGPILLKQRGARLRGSRNGADKCILSCLRMKTRSTKRSVCRCLLALSATDLKRDGVVRPCADCHIMYSTSGAQGAALSGWTPSSPVCACRSILRWCSRTWPLCRTRAAYSHRIPRDPSGEGGLGVTLQHTAFRRSEPRCAVLLCIPHSCMTVWAAATTCVTRRGYNAAATMWPLLDLGCHISDRPSTSRHTRFSRRGCGRRYSPTRSSPTPPRRRCITVGTGRDPPASKDLA